MSLESPRLMIVVPTLGERLQFLSEALASCDPLTSRGIARVVVIVPLGAQDARELARSSGASVVDDLGTGMADAINSALATRAGEDYYVWIGDDDRLVAENVGALINALDQQPSVVLGYGRCRYINTRGLAIGTTRPGLLAQFFLSWGPNLIPHPGTIIRLDGLARIGGFTLGLSFALDLDAFLRLRKVGRFMAFPLVTAEFRWHPDSLTVSRRHASSVEAMAVKRSHLPTWARPLSPLWHWPVAWASMIASEIVSARAQRLP